MIEIVKTIDTSRIHAWLTKSVRDHLTPDVSNYAKGRLRVWLGMEPSLTSPTRLSPGLPWEKAHILRMQELIGWDFDFCLATYSGDGDMGVGISAHRDASYADYEAWGLNVVGECGFNYWEGRESFGYSTSTREFDPKVDDPTSRLILQPGDVVRFNCKNLHSAEPGPGRWNLNFWKSKPVRR